VRVLNPHAFTGANHDASAQAADVVAYFSMEIAVDDAIPTYSGGLGVLAGDTLRAAADLGVPMVGVTLIYRNGYIQQRLDEEGNQSEVPWEWDPEEVLEPIPGRVTITIEGREVHIRAWRHEVKGVFGHSTTVLFLDTDLDENHPDDRAITDRLYGGDELNRLKQEAVLGLGGTELIYQLDIGRNVIYHMNEGHSALIALALLQRRIASRGDGSPTRADIDAVRDVCVFTTHTPVPAGHDKFSWELVNRVLGEERADLLHRSQCCIDQKLNMTYLALRFSHYVNGVALLHEQVSRGMFPDYPIDAITNGVHVPTWASKPFVELFDEHIPNWRRSPEYLRYALAIPRAEILDAHKQAKDDLLAEVQLRTGRVLNPDAFTIGFARRATGYKRASMFFSDMDRLRRITAEIGPVQIIYAGEAHPRDTSGQQMIRDIFQAGRELGDALPVVYLENYNMSLAKFMISGVDIWLNTPLKPHEASGTSGMKAALNGIPSLSVVDGWWYEGLMEGITGWGVGPADRSISESDQDRERADLYDKLQNTILPMFYNDPNAYAEIMRHAIALNGSFFNAQRMVTQYVTSAYHVAHQAARQDLFRMG
jgi:starch phosphorylase